MRNLLRGSRPTSRPARPRAGYRALLALTAALLVAGWASATAAHAASADTRPPGGVLTDPAVRAVDIAQPAIVRIAELYTGRLTLTVCGHSVALPPAGTYTLGGLGSGAFISPNGDILTAGHVVDSKQNWLEGGLFASQRASNDIASVVDTFGAACGIPSLTPDDVANGAIQYLASAAPSRISYTPVFTQPKFMVWRSTAFTGALSASGSSKGYLASLQAVPFQEATVSAISHWDEEDIAVIHVNLTDTPSVQLDDSAQVAAQDRLTILGFPGNGDLQELDNFDPTNLLTLSVNTVTVSAIKKVTSGAQVIQVGGNVEHGDSGGPALDADGRIVGIVSFGLSSPDQLGSTAFFRASNTALKLIQQANVNTQPGEFQKAWQQAFADYAATYPGHWHKAAEEMDALSAKYPDFRGLLPYRAYADTAAGSEQVTIGTQAPGALLLGGIALVIVGLIVALIVGLAVLSRRRRAKAARLAAAAPPSGYSYPPLYGSPQSGYPSAYGNGYPPNAPTDAPPIPTPAQRVPTTQRPPTGSRQ